MPGTPNLKPEPTDATKAPILMMAEILRDDKLTAEDKQQLYDLAKTSFWHRRAMAYIALFGMFAFGLASFFKPEFDVAWLNATFAAIVAAYFGVSALRPNSELKQKGTK